MLYYLSLYYEQEKKVLFTAIELQQPYVFQIHYLRLCHLLGTNFIFGYRSCLYIERNCIRIVPINTEENDANCLLNRNY